MEHSIQHIIFQFIGGLGIFLFGIKTMGDGLKKSAGDKLRDILDRFTTNPVMGVLTGIIVTGLIQSSSGTTVLVVGLVSAGFMNLRQAIGVIMGANIGTTVTAFIIGINIGEYALPILAVGSFLIFFFKNKKIHNLGFVFFGFGALFFGLELMSQGMKPLRSLETFHELTVSMSASPVLGVIIGAVFTLIVQSSSATIGILQGLFAENIITLDASIPVLFGDNIGTTITAALAAIGATVAAKRAAAAHILFNIIGTIIFMILLHPFTSVVEWLQTTLSLNNKMTIAFAHGLFNTSNTLLQLPFIGVLTMMVSKLIPGEDSIFEYRTQHLDPIFIEQSPSIALSQTKQEVIHMGEFAIHGLEETHQFLRTKLNKHADTAIHYESAINNLDRKITDYLIRLSSRSLSDVDSAIHSLLMDSIRDIERIGDHFENIVELIEYKQLNKIVITNLAMDDLDEMFQLTTFTVKEAIQSLAENDKELARDVVKKEEKIDKLERKLRKKHILRVTKGKCTGHAGIVYVDIVSNLERIGDHAVNIAEAVLGERH